MQNILTYSQNMTRVVSHDIMLDAEDRPNLPFAFDALYYEPPTDLKMKMLAGEQVPLTDAEIVACEAFCDSFLDSADYPVFAYDDAGVFAGNMLKTEAQARGLAFRIAEAPDHPASKWTGAGWARIKASILDDGTLILDPASICDRCTLALTAEEWAAFPQPPAPAEDTDFKWDFKEEAWKDVADPLVFAFDEVGAFVGQHLRSYVLARGWGFSREAPKSFPYKMTDAGWERLAAVINESGRCEIQPAGIRDDAILLFTREEWARWPARPAVQYGEEWVWDFRAEIWRDVSNPYGAAFEPDGDRAGVFAGHVARLDAEKAGLGWTRDLPGGEAAKWDGTAWKPVVVVVMDDGTPRFRPETVCGKCMLALTAEEWAAFPQPPAIPEALGSWSWSFARERWEDRRDLTRLRRAAREMAQGRLWYAIRDQLMDVWPDMVELNLAVAELTRVETPYIDACCAQSGEDRSAVEARIRSAGAAVAALQGRMAGQRNRVFARIDAAPDNAAVDAIFAEFLSALEGSSCLPA